MEFEMTRRGFLAALGATAVAVGVLPVSVEAQPSEPEIEHPGGHCLFVEQGGRWIPVLMLTGYTIHSHVRTIGHKQLGRLGTRPIYGVPEHEVEVDGICPDQGPYQKFLHDFLHSAGVQKVRLEYPGDLITEGEVVVSNMEIESQFDGPPRVYIQMTGLDIRTLFNQEN
jgi:hypothetical protein